MNIETMGETMADTIIKVRIFRYDPSCDKKPYYKDYEVPIQKGMSAMNVLDYIYQNLDSTVAYYDHAGCCLGICGRCTGKINGKPGLLCQVEVTGDVVLEPLNSSKVLRDLVISRSRVK